jgi:hypothetical protein
VRIVFGVDHDVDRADVGVHRDQKLSEVRVHDAPGALVAIPPRNWLRAVFALRIRPAANAPV